MKSRSIKYINKVQADKEAYKKEGRIKVVFNPNPSSLEQYFRAEEKLKTTNQQQVR